MDVIAGEWAGRLSAYGDSTSARLAVFWIRSPLTLSSSAVGDLARALRHYREDKIAWPQVVAEAVQVAVMVQRVAVEGDPSRRDATADPHGILFSEVSAEQLPWVISFWAISRSDGEEGYYAAQRMEIGSDGVQPTPEIRHGDADRRIWLHLRQGARSAGRPAS